MRVQTEKNRASIKYSVIGWTVLGCGMFFAVTFFGKPTSEKDRETVAKKTSQSKGLLALMPSKDFDRAEAEFTDFVRPPELPQNRPFVEAFATDSQMKDQFPESSAATLELPSEAGRNVVDSTLASITPSKLPGNFEVVKPANAVDIFGRRVAKLNTASGELIWPDEGFVVPATDANSQTPNFPHSRSGFGQLVSNPKSTVGQPATEPSQRQMLQDRQNFDQTIYQPQRSSGRDR